MKEPKLAKVELRPYILVPMCPECDEVCAKNDAAVFSATELPEMDRWVCPVCNLETRMPQGMFPKLIHEEISVERFELPKIDENPA